MSQPLRREYVFDPQDPRAPSIDQWAEMTAAERERVVAMLPDRVPIEAMPPEGDAHFLAKAGASSTLRRFFRGGGPRGTYISSELAVFYPDEPRFVPDLFAVLDVELHDRMKWVVATEGKGLDLVLEVHVAGDFAKDHQKNVERYARLGIPEYFLFDRGRSRLYGYRLPAAGEGPAAAARGYQRVVPQGGRLPSQVLGLELGIDEHVLRFYDGDALLLEADELIARLGRSLDDVLQLQHQDEAERRSQEDRRLREEAERQSQEDRRLREEEQQRREEEQRRREDAERRSLEDRRLREEEQRLRAEAEGQLARSLAELERLRGR